MAATPASQRTQAGGKKATKPVNGLKHSDDKIHESAHAASLMEKMPSREKLDESVKVQKGDVADQAERQAALAAVEVVKEKEQSNGKHDGGSNAEEDASLLQVTISKRIKVLNKKLQRASTYAELPAEKLNEDMKRIVASKGNLEGAVSELNETLKAIKLSEKEAKKAESHSRKVIIAKAATAAKEDSEKSLRVLFQLLHLHSLINASMQASFAPPPLPTVLQQATSQHVAAIGKIVADLSAPNEVNAFELKSVILSKLISGSDEAVVESVSFKDVLSIVEGLSTSSAQQTTIRSSDAAPAAQEVVEAGAQPQPSILFMQASEIESTGKAVNDAPADIAQAEPEGGAVDGVASSAIAGGASAHGEQGAKGEIIGQAKEDVLRPTQDGSAKAAVSEPVQTTEVSAPASSIATPRVIDWSANDDDDFGDLDIQPDAVKTSASISIAATQALEVSTKEINGASKKQHSPQQHRAPLGNDSAASGKQGRSQNGTQRQAIAKPGPEVDQDGFIVASSKRTKHLQHLQLQQQRGSKSGGQGRGGGRGGAARGRAGSAAVGSAVRGRGRGRSQPGGGGATVEI